MSLGSKAVATLMRHAKSSVRTSALKASAVELAISLSSYMKKGL